MFATRFCRCPQIAWRWSLVGQGVVQSGGMDENEALDRATEAPLQAPALGVPDRGPEMSVERFDELFQALQHAEMSRRTADAAIFAVMAEIVAASADYSRQLDSAGTPDYHRLAVPPRPGMVRSSRVGSGPGKLAELAVTNHVAQELDISEFEAAALMRRSDRAVNEYPKLHVSLASGEVSRKAIENAVDELEKIVPDPVEPPLANEDGEIDADTTAQYELEIKESLEKAELLREKLVKYLEPRLVGKTAWQVKKLGENWRKRHHLKTPAAAHKVAREGRYVSVQAAEDGMSFITAYVPTVAAEALQRRLDQAVEISKRTTDPDGRSKDEIRTDAFLNLLLPSPAVRAEQQVAEAQGESVQWVTDGSWLEQICANISVLIPASVLTGDDDSPRDSPKRSIQRTDDAQIQDLGSSILSANGSQQVRDGGIAEWAEGERFGVIDPESARELAKRSKIWRRLLMDPFTGTVSEIDSYQPSREQRDALLWRDRFCRVPGCPRPARACDADHIQEHQDGGETTLENLALLCRKHHRLKSLGHLKITSNSDGSLKIADRFGNTVISHPWEYRGFAVPKRFIRYTDGGTVEAA